MANRRISQLPILTGSEVAEEDLLTMVHVFEVDPTLKNKKITVSGFKNYLDFYYLTATGGTLYGSLIVQNNLTVSGTANISGIVASGNSTFAALVVQTTATVSGTISGAIITGDVGRYTTLTGTTGIFTTVSGTTITGATGQFNSLTGNTAGFTTVTGTTVTGTTAKFTTITGTTLLVTAASGATAALVCSGVVSGDTSGFIIKGPLIILP